MKQTRAVIFDLDGVLVDTARFHFLAWQKMANGIGIEFGHKENEQLKGVSRVRSLEKILSWGNTSVSEQEFNQLMDSKNEDYLAHVNRMDSSDLLPGVAHSLNYLKENNVPMAVGSASKNARHILSKLGISDDFDAIVDGTDVSNAKPDPEVFLQAAKQLQVEPSSCIVFEDSIAGIDAANTASMLSIGIGKKDMLNKANYVFQNFTEIDTEFLNEILNRK